MQDDQRELRNRERRLTADELAKKNQIKELEREEEELVQEKRILKKETEKLRAMEEEVLEKEKILDRKEYEMETDYKIIEKDLRDVREELKRAA